MEYQCEYEFRDNVMTGYRQLESYEINDLPDGTEVIVETKHWESKRGFPLEPTFNRAIIGHHMTCAGIMADMVSEPNFEFPEIPKWQGRIYAANSGNMQLWIRDYEQSYQRTSYDV